MENTNPISNINQTLKLSDEKLTLICSCGESYETYALLNVLAPQKEHLCFNCRAIKRQEEEARQRENILTQVQREKEGWHKSCGIPIRFLAKTFETFDKNQENEKALEMSLQYAELFPLTHGRGYHSLGLISDKIWGVGKSHLACSIAHRVIDRWVSINKCPVYYVTEPALFSRVKATFNHNKDEETEEAAFNDIINIPLLIVDDVGKEEIADPRFVQRVWFRIINGRYDNMLPVVITANMSPDGIANHLGGSRNNEATFDRLYEMLQGVFYEIRGTSYRRKIKTEGK